VGPPNTRPSGNIRFIHPPVFSRISKATPDGGKPQVVLRSTAQVALSASRNPGRDRTHGTSAERRLEARICGRQPGSSRSSLRGTTAVLEDGLVAVDIGEEVNRCRFEPPGIRPRYPRRLQSPERIKAGNGIKRRIALGRPSPPEPLSRNVAPSRLRQQDPAATWLRLIFLAFAELAQGGEQGLSAAGLRPVAREKYCVIILAWQDTR